MRTPLQHCPIKAIANAEDVTFRSAGSNKSFVPKPRVGYIALCASSGPSSQFGDVVGPPSSKHKLPRLGTVGEVTSLHVSPAETRQQRDQY